jgi:Tol biopolymer transport system component
MRPNGREQKRLVESALEPSWAPDSRAIAYVADGPSGGRLGLREINADGTGDVLLVRGGVSSPAFSPDGNAIAFVRASSLVVRGSGTSRTIARGAICCVSWSADGTRLAFGRDGRVQIVSPDGSKMRDLGQGWGSVWSPKGSRIAFVDAVDVIVVVDVRTGKMRRLPAPGRYPDQFAQVVSFSWSPNGDAIVYARGQAGYPNSSTYLGTVTLGGRVRFLPYYPQAVDLSWSRSPDALRYRPPLPEGPIVVGRELRARGRVGDLAVNGDHVALGFCVSLAVWPASYLSTEWLVRSPLCAY